MNIDELIKRVEVELENVEDEARDQDGLLRLESALKNYSGKYKLIWSDDLIEQIKNEPQKAVHKTGMPLLDDLLGGLVEEQLVTLSGSTKHGKTQFGMFLTSKYQELNPVVIGLEQSAREIIRQYSTNGYPLPKFLTPENIAPQVTVDWIEERIIEGIAKYNTKFIFIDHLGYIDDTVGGKLLKENQAYRIEKIMQGLKSIAKRWKVIILLNVHIAQADEGNPPSLQDLKGSSAIAQESDKVLFVWRKNSKEPRSPRVYTNKTMLTVAASRSNGKNGHTGFIFDTTTGLYTSDNQWVEDMMKSAEVVSDFDTM